MTPAAAVYVYARSGLSAFSRPALKNGRTGRVAEVNSRFASWEASPAFSDCNNRLQRPFAATVCNNRSREAC